MSWRKLLPRNRGSLTLNMLKGGRCEKDENEGDIKEILCILYLLKGEQGLVVYFIFSFSTYEGCYYYRSGF